MIAVIERAEQVVWGIGPNPDMAMSDAKKEIENKPELTVGTLEYVALADDAPLDSDGFILWEYCNLDTNHETQMGLF